MDVIYRQLSQGYQHDYAANWQLPDVDMSGRPCGPQAAFATKGYFANQRNRRGRQVGRCWPLALTRWSSTDSTVAARN